MLHTASPMIAAHASEIRDSFVILMSTQIREIIVSLAVIWVIVLLLTGINAIHFKMDGILLLMDLKYNHSIAYSKKKVIIYTRMMASISKVIMAKIVILLQGNSALSQME